MKGLKISLIIIFAVASIFFIGSCHAEEEMPIIDESNEPVYKTSGMISAGEPIEEEEPEPALELTRTEILECASLFSYYYRRDNKFPTYVTITHGNEKIVINRSQFIHLSSSFITTDNPTITLNDLQNLPCSSKTAKYTRIYPVNYNKIAQRTKEHIFTYKSAPYLVKIGTRNIYYLDLLEIYSEMLIYYNYHKEYPDFVSIGKLNKLPKINSAYVDNQISKYSYRKYLYRKKLSIINYYIKRTRNIKHLRSLRNSYDYYLKKYQYASKRLTYFYKKRSSPWYVPKDYRIYLSKTRNCQVNDYRIIAQTLILSELTPYETADNLFTYVRDICLYTFYYNTRYGAIKTLKIKKANCIDQAHLLIAMARSVGIPARYRHAHCKFSTMTVGHVWVQLYVNGRWYTADPTSYRNTLGKQNNCKILYWKGRYLALPF
ncbi:MAG: hypothetical protein Kow0019_11490 [Methanobacteriaceae archaeon]